MTTTRICPSRARVAPGVVAAWHRLSGTSERYPVTAGRGRVEIASRRAVELEAGDVVRIPANVAQRIASIGDSDLIFYAICAPRFTPDCYVAME